MPRRPCKESRRAFRAAGATVVAPDATPYSPPMHAPRSDHPSASPEPSIAELIAARPHLADARDGRAAAGGRAAERDRRRARHARPGSIRRRHHARAHRALAAALGEAGSDAHIHYAVKANDHLAVLRAVRRARAPAPTWSAAASCCGPARPAFPPGASCSPASARARANCASRSPRTSRQINVESAEELDMLSAHRRPHGAHGAGRAAHQPGRRRRHARQDQHRPGARQVRHPVSPTPPRSMPAPPRCRASQPVGLAVHIGSQVLSRRAVSRRLRAGSPSWCAALRAAGHAGRHGGLRRRPRHRLPRRAGGPPGGARRRHPRDASAGSDVG